MSPTNEGEQNLTRAVDTLMEIVYQLRGTVAMITGDETGISADSPGQPNKIVNATEKIGVITEIIFETIGRFERGILNKVADSPKAH